MPTHILNGDALFQSFPFQKEKTIVMREVLMEGPSSAVNTEAHWQLRGQYLTETYQISHEEYQTKTLSQYENIEKIHLEDEVMLWFEEDLFCQTNLWYCLWRLHHIGVEKISLVMPPPPHQYSFGHLSVEDLKLLPEDKQPIRLQDLILFSQLWNAYTLKDLHQLDRHAHGLSNFPFLEMAITALKMTIPDDHGFTEVDRIIKSYITELGPDFKKVFVQFWKEHPYFGYGDAQLKRKFDQLV